jgi:Type II secretion system (T2SS), protein G
MVILKYLAWCLAGIVLAGGAVVLCAPELLRQEPHAVFRLVEAKLHNLKSAYETWCINNPKNTKCPTLEDFKEDGTLSRDQNLNDPWGHSLRVRCRPERFEIEFVSLGRDGVENTEDDIRITADWQPDAGR